MSLVQKLITTSLPKNIFSKIYTLTTTRIFTSLKKIEFANYLHRTQKWYGTVLRTTQYDRCLTNEMTIWRRWSVRCSIQDVIVRVWYHGDLLSSRGVRWFLAASKICAALIRMKGWKCSRTLRYRMKDECRSSGPFRNRLHFGWWSLVWLLLLIVRWSLRSAYLCTRNSTCLCALYQRAPLITSLISCADNFCATTSETPRWMTISPSRKRRCSSSQLVLRCCYSFVKCKAGN